MFSGIKFVEYMAIHNGDPYYIGYMANSKDYEKYLPLQIGHQKSLNTAILNLLGIYLVHNNYRSRQLEDLDFGNKQCLFPLLITRKSSLRKDISRSCVAI